MPSKLVLKESFFEEDVKKLTKFQNNNKTFGVFGFPPFFDCRSESERITDKGKTNYNSETNEFDVTTVTNVISECISINRDCPIIIKSTTPVGFTASIRKKFKNFSKSAFSLLRD